MGLWQADIALIRLFFLALFRAHAIEQHKVARYLRVNTILARKYSLAHLPLSSRACLQRATISQKALCFERAPSLLKKKARNPPRKRVWCDRLIDSNDIYRVPSAQSVGLVLSFTERPRAFSFLTHCFLRANSKVELFLDFFVLERKLSSSSCC